MSWGTELWDQYENLSQHTHKGIEFLERYGQFVRERCAVELEYAGKLRRLVKNYQPKKKEEDEYQYSGCKAFRLLLHELGDLAGQREVVAENLQLNVVRELQLLAKELKDERKKQLGSGARLTAALNSAVASLDRAKKAYERAARDAERALDAYQRADADLNLSRAEVEKQRMNLTIKSQQCEEAKTEYANQLQKTNDLQRLHYEDALPQVFKTLQDLDEKRIKNIKNFMLSMVDTERNVFPIISQCLDGMVRAAHTINEKEDAQLVIERYKSGFSPPADVPFEELSARGGGPNPNAGSDSADGPHAPHHTAARGTLSGGKLKKRVGLFAIFGSNKLKMAEACNHFKNNISMECKEEYNALPPNQRRKRLEAKIGELRRQANQEQAALDGLMKMKAVYEANPALGDPMTVEGQLNESGHKLEKLRSSLAKYASWLEEAGGSTGDSLAPPSARLNGGSSHRHSVGSHSDSLSRSASDSSVSTGHAPHNSVHHASASPESGLGTSHNSLPAGAGVGGHMDRHLPAPSGDSELGEGVEEDVDGEFYYEPELRPLGTCKALYPFEATSAGSMRMSAGEVLVVVEADQGDGWTRVRRTAADGGGEEGFVPTTYIHVTLFDAH